MGGIAKARQSRLAGEVKRWFMLVTCCGPFAWAAEPYQQAWKTRMAPIVPEGYLCRHSTGPIQIDGKLEESEWSAVQWTKDFVDIEGAAKPKPALRTRVKMLWDQENLYIAAEMEEPQIWATLLKHDSVIFNDPDFEVFLDPDGDTHEYGEFEMNALNTTWDLFLPKPYKDGGKPDDAWEMAGLKSAVRLDGTLNNPSDQDRGWCVEIAMPWSSLSRLTHRMTPPSEGEQWRINLSRVEWQIDVVDGKVIKKPKTPEFNWVWSPQGVIDMHRPEMWGRLQFAKATGDAAIHEDPSRPARQFLQEIYYAQRDWNKAHGRWAKSLNELGVKTNDKSLSDPRLSATDEGYECEVTLGSMRWSIRQDGKISRSED